LETKRFIGNDMPRIYARIRRDFGPDAVIVSTRSLLREDADPLIEVIAAGPEAGSELPLELQRTLIAGALQRVEQPRALTIGDLEDIAVREQAEVTAADEFDQALHERLGHVAAEPAQEWLTGYVASAPSRPARAQDQRRPLIPPADEKDEPRGAVRFEPPSDPVPAAPPPIEWAPRPRPSITSRPRPEPPPADPTPLNIADRFTVAGPGVAAGLIVAGFSASAAQLVAEQSGGSGSPRDALTELLTSREVLYPDERRTALITIQGPVGAGRTTALMRMALDCADSGREAILVAADATRVAAREQVHAYAEAIGIPAVDAFSAQELVRVVAGASLGACLFVDVPAGPWRSPPLPNVEHCSYVTLPAHWSSPALERALEEFDSSHLSGAVLTFTDLAVSLTPALSLLIESGLGVAFLSSSRDVGSGIEVADPLTLASGVFTSTSRETTNGRLIATA
jgi:flagellar biosynthesis protein FlhF